MDELVHLPDCALATTHHLTCSCDAWTRGEEAAAGRVIPSHVWTRLLGTEVEVYQGSGHNVALTIRPVVSDATPGDGIVSDTCPVLDLDGQSPTSGSASPA